MHISKLKGVAGIGLVILASGCNISAPRPRMGTLPTPPPGPRFVDPYNLGRHSYYFNPFEKNGIVYTCKAGHIDITHLRWSADNTKYLTKKTRETLMKNKKGFSYNLAWEPSTHLVKFTYPENWRNMEKKDKEKIANEIAFEVGPYLAYNSTLWHEIITWFGTNFATIEPEFNSAFSWEDVFSNLLGIRLAVHAIRSEYGYDKAMEIAINEELEKLGVQSKSIAIYASEKMRGIWYVGLFLVDTKKRNIDIGLDGYVTSILVPGINECNNAEPASYPVPNIDILDKYAFSLNYEIKPNVWEAGKIFRVVNDPGNPKNRITRISPERHYPKIIEHIKKQAVEKYGYDID